jgi:hypothetical protein
VLRYDADAIVVTDKKGAALKTLPLASVKGAEYSYAKSPRWRLRYLSRRYFCSPAARNTG